MPRNVVNSLESKLGLGDCCCHVDLLLGCALNALADLGLTTPLARLLPGLQAEDIIDRFESHHPNGARKEGVVSPERMEYDCGFQPEWVALGVSRRFIPGLVKR